MRSLIIHGLMAEGGQASIYKATAAGDVWVVKGDRDTVRYDAPPTSDCSSAQVVRIANGTDLILRHISLQGKSADASFLAAVLQEQTIEKYLNTLNTCVIAKSYYTLPRLDADGKCTGFVTVMKAYDGDLNKYIADEMATNGAFMSLQQLQRLGVQLLSAIVPLHSRGIAHHDLSGGNFLTKRVGPDNVEIVVSDFGYARWYPHCDAGRAWAPSTSGNIISPSLWRIIGTIWYHGPESLLFFEKDRYDPRAEDVAAVAINIFGACAGGLCSLLSWSFTDTDLSRIEHGIVKQLFTYFTLFGKYDDACFGANVSALEAHLQQCIDAVMARVPCGASWEERRNIFAEAREFVALRLNPLLIHDTMEWCPQRNGHKCLPIRALLCDGSQGNSSPLVALQWHCTRLAQKTAGTCAERPAIRIASNIGIMLSSPGVGFLAAQQALYSKSPAFVVPFYRTLFRMLSPNPMDRPTVDELLSADWSFFRVAHHASDADAAGGHLARLQPATGSISSLLAALMGGCVVDSVQSVVPAAPLGC